MRNIALWNIRFIWLKNLHIPRKASLNFAEEETYFQFLVILSCVFSLLKDGLYRCVFKLSKSFPVWFVCFEGALSSNYLIKCFERELLGSEDRLFGLTQNRNRNLKKR